MKKGMREKGGFSPLEVMIALVILAVGIVAAMKLFPVGLRQVRAAQERTVVSELATSKFGELRTAGGRNLLYSVTGIEGVPPYYWQSTVSTAEAADAIYKGYTTSIYRTGSAPEVYLHRATFTVDMLDGRREQFVTYVAEP